MRPIPHHDRGEETTEKRVRLTTRHESAEELDDDEVWIAAQEF